MWPFKIAGQHIIALSLRQDSFTGAYIEYNNASKEYTLKNLNTCTMSNGELEGMVIFDPTRLKHCIASVGPAKMPCQLRVCITGPSMIESDTQENFGAEKDSIGHEASVEIPGGKSLSFYRCAMAREHLFQYTLLAHMCRVSLTHLVSGTWARINACASSKSGHESPWSLAINDLSQLCFNVPEQSDLLVMTELVGLCYLEKE